MRLERGRGRETQTDWGRPTERVETAQRTRTEDWRVEVEVEEEALEGGKRGGGVDGLAQHAPTQGQWHW